MSAVAARTSPRTNGLTTVTRVAAAVGTILAPIHALSRFATEAGAEDLESPIVRTWAEPAAEALAPLLTWSDLETVYVSFGKVWLVVVVAAFAGALAVRRRRQPTGAERWGWRIALPGYAVLSVGTFITYWTPLLETGFAVSVTGLLVSIIGSAVLGIALLRTRFGSRATAWLLAAWLPLLLALGAVIALGAGILPMAWAWALATGTSRG